MTTPPTHKKPPALPVAPGGFKKLPPAATKFIVTIDTPKGEGDGDLWIARVHKDGTADVLCWFEKKYDRPDLGTNSQGNPFQAFPELDVITAGDCRTGGESEVRAAKGEAAYDEGGKFDLTKAPPSVVAYVPFVTIYDHDDVGLTLGMFSKLSMVVAVDGGATFETEPASTDPMALCYTPGAIRRSDDGTGWEIHGTGPNDLHGTPDNPWVVSNKLGAKLPTP